ncbi:hypothetical protein CBS147343_6653 [Aspergillus niger]|nr:hypothetical protein CBS133816_4596 [Aspergillus niger]KAI2848542.1 hypothetical protein CBS12448_9080 [Aspergillus niger]KAI2915128.1 hypothetical protein CBS147371_5945 [Aspergillus niger]KAI2915769.1 hypothetical protein CBS147320_9817 [Aspergillus niger]KAI2942757.1 hypothetical protein CBS147321_5103 [Aspergillus niger]
MRTNFYSAMNSGGLIESRMVFEHLAHSFDWRQSASNASALAPPWTTLASPGCNSYHRSLPHPSNVLPIFTSPYHGPQNAHNSSPRRPLLLASRQYSLL